MLHTGRGNPGFLSLQFLRSVCCPKGGVAGHKPTYKSASL